MDSGREYAGVGFIIAPWLYHAIIGFTQLSNRLASLQIRIKHGSIIRISAYAPHNDKSFEERFKFYAALEDFYNTRSCHGPIFILVDLNARLREKFEDEIGILGEYYLQDLSTEYSCQSNRDLLINLCYNLNLCIVNVFFEHLPEEQVTYFDM